jgi:hypothetical protein
MVIWIYQKLQKNLQKKKIITLSKPEKKINEFGHLLKNKLIKKSNFLGMSFN